MIRQAVEKTQSVEKTHSTNVNWLFFTVLTSSAVVGIHLPARAASFNFTYGPGTSLQQIVGFETAGNIWSSYLTDNVTINLHVGVSSNLPGNAVGGALPGMQAFQSYEAFYNALNNDKTSSDDATATSNLQAHRYSDGYLRYNAMFESGNTWYNRKISLTNANAKALGMLGNSSALDGTILMSNLANTGYQWNYDYARKGSASSNSLDFLSVALHEIGHTLGFISGMDSAKKAESQASYDENINRLMKTTSLDMFRYTDYSAARGRVDLAAGVDSFFSIDGGKTAIADFARGTQDLGLGSDGYQGSHWENRSTALGIMGPTIRPGERRNVLGLDLRALDVIGWNVNKSASINLATLETQAKQKVAQKIADRWGWGQGYASWVDNYITSGSNLTAAGWISGDRTTAIDSMIASSQVYDMGYSRWWQEAFWQHSYHSTLDEFENADPASVPEPSTLGFIGFALVAFRWVRANR